MFMHRKRFGIRRISIGWLIPTFTSFFVLLILSLPAASETREWSYRVTPYAWLPTLSLDTAIDNGPGVSSETDLLDVLDFAFLAAAEARKGRWGVIGEVNYLDLSDEGSYANGAFNVDTGLQGLMAGAAVSYRFYELSGASADVLAGARAWSLDADIDFQRLPAVSRSTSFVDPIIGIRGDYDLNESWFATGMLDFGGFGVGSDIQWDGVARIAYRLTPNTSLALGYRHFYLAVDRDGLDLNASISGPFLAFDFSW